VYRPSGGQKVRNLGTLKTLEWKTREWKSRHQIAGVEIAGEGKVWKAKVIKMCMFLTIDRKSRYDIYSLLSKCLSRAWTTRPIWQKNNTQWNKKDTHNDIKHKR